MLTSRITATTVYYQVTAFIKYEAAHSRFIKAINRKTTRIRTDDDELSLMGATAFKGNTSSEESDTCFK
jgi:predicted metal-dependent hydrolase